MIDFKMTTAENFASFVDAETGVVVFVDSFDNIEFDVRVGGFLETKPLGSIKAKDDKTLNIKLANIYQQSIQT
jgi:hypothetical protein